MLKTPMARRGMVVAPHHLAAECGLAVLRDGGNAVEAMVAAAATIAVVYPHMNGLGGDGFWLIAPPGRIPIAIEACGVSGRAVTPDLYRAAGHDAVPARGALAANTVAGAVSGWAAAIQVARKLGGRIPLPRLLTDAVHHAREGFPVTDSQAHYTALKRSELEPISGFADIFLPDGAVPAVGRILRQPALADTLERLARAGLDDFYRGDLARVIAADLERAGSPLTLDDLGTHAARSAEALCLPLKDVSLYNMPPPTQGLASLMILGVFDRLGVDRADGFDHIHGLVEATKHAFHVRDVHVGDPFVMTEDPWTFLQDTALDRVAGSIHRSRAAPWPAERNHGDTIWMGAVDANGTAVSYIQSIYWEFGSGVVLPDTGILWQNRGSAFRLDPTAVNALAPRRRPLHTLNPALAVFTDGRVMPYGAMGGDGQPQTQAAVFTRYARFGRTLQAAVTAPRWLLGRAWGAESTTLKLESRFAPETVAALEAAGHAVEMVEDFSDVMGHAGALVRHPDGIIEGAADPRSNGAVAAF